MEEKLRLLASPLLRRRCCPIYSDRCDRSLGDRSLGVRRPVDHSLDRHTRLRWICKNSVPGDCSFALDRSLNHFGNQRGLVLVLQPNSAFDFFHHSQLELLGLALLLWYRRCDLCKRPAILSLPPRFFLPVLNEPSNEYSPTSRLAAGRNAWQRVCGR